MRRNLTFIISLLSFVLISPSALSLETPIEPKKSASDESKPIGDDEILSGPFSEYGEFDTSDDEASDEKFFQYSRFFGVGVGAGFTSPTGNAAKLYQGGYPMVDFRINYWFDFHIALQLSAQNSKHSYDAQPDGVTDVNFFRALGQIKYYIDTRNLPAAITFVGPHLIAGGGYYQRTDNVGVGNTVVNSVGPSVFNQSAFGANVGAGFELTIIPKKTYMQLEYMYHFVTWKDQFDPKFQKVGIADRSGNWMTFGVVLLWTW